jgi:hypothetical protein
MLAGGALGLFFLQSRAAPLPPLTRLLPRELHPAAAMVPGSAAVVIAGEWVAAQRGDGLCTALKRIDPDRVVLCVRARFDVAGAEALFQARAQGARARVIATAQGERMRIRALGGLEKNELFRWDFDVDLHVATDLDRLAILLDALDRVAASTPSADRAATIPCPDFGTSDLDEVGLLTLLVVPACEGVRLAEPRYLGPCAGQPGGDASAACALGRYLFARDKGGDPDALALLRKVRDDGPEPFRRSATLALAWQDCRERRVAEAVRGMDVVRRGASRCDEIRLAGLAACIMAAGYRSDAPLDDWVVQLAQTLILPADAKVCPSEQIADAHATRAHWEMRMQYWEPAATGYELAFRLDHEPQHLLDAGEALLHMTAGPFSRDARVVDLLQQAGPRIRQIEEAHAPANGDGGAGPVVHDRRRSVKAALLRWALSRRRGDASSRAYGDACLLDLYVGLAPGEAPIAPGTEDHDFEELLCKDAKACVYEALKEPTPDKLQRALAAH